MFKINWLKVCWFVAKRLTNDELVRFYHLTQARRMRGIRRQWRLDARVCGMPLDAQSVLSRIASAYYERNYNDTPDRQGNYCI